MKINSSKPKLVKLSGVPTGRRVRLYSDDGDSGTIVQYFHINRMDGVYTFCRMDKTGDVVHLSASTLVGVL
jgi:hypothetical protein